MIKMSQAAALAVLVSTGLFLAGLSGGTALADSEPSAVTVERSRPQITVVGEGSISATPDIMRLDTGVEVRRPTAGAAFTDARTAAAALTRALLATGIAAEDLRTDELTLSPEYKEYPTISGYRATQGVEAVVRDIDDADDVVDAAAAVGEAVRFDGVTFEVSDNHAPLRLAREAAFEDARSRATQYAELASRGLGRVMEISEQSVTPPTPVRGFAGIADKASISPGRRNVSVSVRVVYELE
ncbi:SIMPL domain-containing protein [Streptosporangium sp. NBC_01495]|uniref:SIMPL domain-containing protein n=1 Tax=Streptosporangium sp. NBC_01495 TaxID=2903899 RepID=UPI002E32C143|nr:SIMPL domain-containing protein [Streptosporangium sp. NBC_01495]